MKLSPTHFAPCPHPLPTIVANVPSVWTTTLIISSQTHGSSRPPNLNPLSKSLPLSQPASTKLLGSQSAINCLGMSHKDLIPVTLQMHANNTKTAILGAAILKFSGQSNSGKRLVTCQLLYITDSTNKTFLSREACTDLGLIPNQFPSIGEALQHPGENAISNTHFAQQPPATTKLKAPLQDSGLIAHCDCPKRQLPLPKPTLISFPPAEENREKLQQ